MVRWGRGYPAVGERSSRGCNRLSFRHLLTGAATDVWLVYVSLDECSLDRRIFPVGTPSIADSSTAGTECSRIFRELEDRRAALIAEFTGWSFRRLCFRPSPGAWSVVEVLDHIVKAESGTIEDVRLGLRDPHVLGDEERPGIAALDRALRSDRTFKVPAEAAAIYPDDQTTLSEIAERWEEARSALRSLLETLVPYDLRCGVFYHPFAGWMTVVEVLDHFSAHLYHHGFQLERLRVSSEGL